MTIVTDDPGSFRDPSGRIHLCNGRVFRTVMPCAVKNYEFVEATGVIKRLEKDGFIIESKIVDPSILGEKAKGARYVLEHPRLPFISYPYEWSFSMLKAASLRHIDIHLRLLEHGITLSDASAYNIQFIGPDPIFIDRLSFRRYKNGEFWTGLRQFCEQFLNPLLFRTIFGVPHNQWYRGVQEGITSEDLNRLLPWTRKCSWKIFKYIVLPTFLQEKASKGLASRHIKSYQKQNLPLAYFKRMLKSLRGWIETLEPKDSKITTTWEDYEKTCSYSPDEAERKRSFIINFIKSIKPKLCWDIGCNTGEFSTAALEACAEYVVGFDFDQKALDIAFLRAKERSLALLPLFLDAANPTPNQGWAEKERKGIKARADADAILALAFIHHLAITRNVPLPNLLSWLIGMAPHGIIEYIPKSDPMIEHMLCFREDIFENYNEESFLVSVEALADIVEKETISKSGRFIIRYSRR